MCPKLLIFQLKVKPMKKKLFFSLIGIVVIFMAMNVIFSLEEYNFANNLNRSLTQALARSEEEKTYYQCFDCTIYPGPQLWQIVSPCPFGYLGDISIPCGYNYICD